MGNTNSPSELKIDFEILNYSEKLEAIKQMDKAVQPQMMEELTKKLYEYSDNIDRYYEKEKYRKKLFSEEMLLTEEEKRETEYHKKND